MKAAKKLDKMNKTIGDLIEEESAETTIAKTADQMERLAWRMLADEELYTRLTQEQRLQISQAYMNIHKIAIEMLDNKFKGLDKHFKAIK